MRVLNFTVPYYCEGIKVSMFLRVKGEFSASIIQTLRHTQGGILKNGMPSRTIDKVKKGDIITVNLPEKSSEPLLFDFPLDIIYEDDDILVLNKPAGISMHPTYNHPNGTLANAAAAYLKKRGKGEACIRAIGRLDKGTSGVVVLALNSYAASRLNNNLKKEYLAVIRGCLSGFGVIDAPIFRPFPDKTIRAVGHGDESVTHWQAQKQFDSFTLVRVFPQTGRTHQIRVHFAHIGMPLIGDEMYGGPQSALIKRPALHCERVSLIHNVTGENMIFKAPVPEDFRKLLK
ncbi:MAG: Ribosomal large subunit pseudouridine synthase D [Firmicutes bacterium ADurb.Bin300]|nr:MAG: Ribosomal large subunit pseudouridine synthase D [Firmicutes bacterium ADurb.Bin300]HOD02458.1 RluA family pseudouridine synthase [Clostridiales bacterium]